MRLNSRYAGRSCSSPREFEFEPDSSGVGTPISSPYDPFVNYLSPRPKFLRYNPERHCEVLRRLEGGMDGFGGMSTGSNSDGSISENSAKQEQEDSDFDGGACDQVEMPQICSLRWLCELLLLLLVLVLLMVCICHMSISSPLHNFEDWHKSPSCTWEDVSDKLVEFVEIDVSSISSPSDEVGDNEGTRGNLSSTHEEVPEKIDEFYESRRGAAQTDVDSLGDIRDATEWIEVGEVIKGSSQENYRYDELDEAVTVQDGGIWKRVGVELEESSKAAETRVEKNDNVCEEENGGLEETHGVGEVTSGFIGSALLCAATTILAFVLVLYLRRKKNLVNDSSPTTRHSFRLQQPIKCTRKSTEKSKREDHLASDPVCSSPLKSSPSLGSFTTTEMMSTKREDGTGEAWISIATPVRRSSRIHGRAIRSRQHLMSSS